MLSFINLIILAIMAVVCAIVDSVLEHYYYPRDAYWLYNDNQSDDNPSINGLVTWAFALITYVELVPSLSSKALLNMHITVSRISSRFLCTFQSSLCALSRLRSSISTRISIIKRQTSLRLLGLGIFQMIWDRLSISFRIRRGH